MQTILRWQPRYISAPGKPPANSDGESRLEGTLGYRPADKTTLIFRTIHRLLGDNFPTGRFMVKNEQSDTEVRDELFVLYLEFQPEMTKDTHAAEVEEAAIAEMLIKDYCWKWKWNIREK